MCDTTVLVEPGRVLFAKASDRDANEAQPIEWFPAATHPAGSVLRCTHLEIPQVADTRAVVLSRPFWMWGAEMGANDAGVVIGNEAVFTREPYAEVGLTGMDLVRLGLERAGSAEAAVDVIVHLLDEHGQGGGCGLEDPSFTYHNSFLVADHRQAFVLETAGRRRAVEQVTHGARSISNGLTIPGFAERFSDRLRSRVSGCRVRRAATEQWAARASGPADLAAALRDHGDGLLAPTYTALTGAMAAPCMHAGGVVVASQTTAAWISELSAEGARHWATGTAATCTSVFKPVVVDEPVELGPELNERADDTHLWWRHEHLHRWALRDPERLLPRFTPERDEVERSFFERPPPSVEAFATADALTARWTERIRAVEVDDTRPVYVRRFWRVRDHRAGRPVLPDRAPLA